MNKITDLKIDKTWTLFLDRDGVINKRLMDDYVKNIGEFEFLPDTLEAIAKFSDIFGKIFVVTNQRGISRGLMTTEDLNDVTDFMLEKISKAGGKIDKVYFCPHDRDENCGCRKPAIGMALKAKEEFTGVDFNKAIMVGDTSSDIKFGKNAGMYTVWITSDEGEGIRANSLLEFAQMLEA